MALAPQAGGGRTMAGFGAAAQEAFPLLLAMSNGMMSGNGVFSQAGPGLAAMMQMRENKDIKTQEEAAKKQAEAARAAEMNNVSGFFGNLMGGQGGGMPGQTTGAPRNVAMAEFGGPTNAAASAMSGDLSEPIRQTAASIGMDPVDLATIISYETAGTFDPTKAGPTTQWGQHRGLIQFGEPQAEQYGVDWQKPVTSQLGPDGAVAKYFKENGWQPGMGMMDAYSIVNAGGPGLYNRSDANNGGAPGTVADKVNNQMSGHRDKAMAMLGGQGNAGVVSAQNSQLPQGMVPTQRQSKFDPQRLAQIVMSPNLPASVKQLAMDRAFPSETKVEWQRFDGPDGGVYAFNPQNMETVPIMPGNGPKQTAADLEITRMVDVGVPYDVAVKINSGVYKTITDPTTKETVVIDFGTMKPVMSLGQDPFGTQSDPQQTDPQSGAAPQAPPQTSPDLGFGSRFGAAEDSFGLGGTARGLANTASDVIGLGQPFPEVSSTQRDFSVMREDLTNSLANAYDGRVPAFLLQNIQELTPQAGSLREGPGGAQDKLRALGRSLQSEIQTVDQSMKRRLSPSDREVYMKRKQALESSIAKIQQAIGGFSTGDGAAIRPDVADRLRAYE